MNRVVKQKTDYYIFSKGLLRVHDVTRIMISQKSEIDIVHSGEQKNSERF